MNLDNLSRAVQIGVKHEADKIVEKIAEDAKQQIKLQLSGIVANVLNKIMVEQFANDATREVFFTVKVNEEKFNNRQR